MATHIQTDSPETRAMLDRAMAAGGYDEVGELLHDLLADRLLEQDRVKSVLASKLQEGLDSPALPLDETVLHDLDNRLRAIADEARDGGCAKNTHFFV